MSNTFKSILGRRLGLDHDGYLSGTFGGVRSDITVGSSSSTGAHAWGGISRLDSTASSTFALAAPQTGVTHRIVATKTSTAASMTLASGNILSSTGGSTFAKISLITAGQSAVLVGLSTSLAMVLGTTADGMLLS